MWKLLEKLKTKSLVSLSEILEFSNNTLNSEITLEKLYEFTIKTTISFQNQLENCSVPFLRPIKGDIST